MCSGRESIFTGLAAIFVYFCFCSQQEPYCSLRVRHARMLYPVAIYTIPLLGQRLQIAPMLCVPFTLGLVTCHPPGGSSHRFMLFLPTLCPLHSTCCWCGLIFLIYRFETGLFNLTSTDPCSLSSSGSCAYFRKFYHALFVLNCVTHSATYWRISACTLPHLFDPLHLFH